MARKPRLHLDEGIYHVMLRGNGGQEIFFDDEDRLHFYLLLQQGVERYKYRVHGFCLMSNHVHLVLEVGAQPLAKIMQNLSFRYTRWVNKKQKCIGHLFQGRDKAILVDRDSYLLELVRYVHLNSVRAKLVRQAHLYPWSGHRAYLGRQTLSWLTTEWVLNQFGMRLAACRKHYEVFVREGYGEGRRDEFHCGGNDDGRLLGDDQFARRVVNKPDVIQKHVTSGCARENRVSGIQINREDVGVPRARESHVSGALLNRMVGATARTNHANGCCETVRARCRDVESWGPAIGAEVAGIEIYGD